MLSDVIQKWADECKREALAQGLQQGLEQGREQGIEQGIERGLERGLKKGLARGREEGIQQGIERGVAQRNDGLALKMLTGGYEDAIILQLAEVSEDQLRKLKAGLRDS